MPIIFRPKGNFAPPEDPTLYRQWAEAKLASVPLDWDGNRTELDAAPADERLHEGAEICTFIGRVQLTAPQNANQGYRLNGHAGNMTLHQSMRAQMLEEVTEKQNVLLDMHCSEDVSGGRLKASTATDRAALAALPWPTANVVVEAKFKDQPAPGMGTGFSIGKNMIVTAGHCFPDLGNRIRTGQNVHDYYAVFGLTHAMLVNNNISRANGFGLRRLVYRGYDRNDFTWPAGAPPKKPEWTGVTNEAIHQQLCRTIFYDCAVMELEPVYNGQQMIAPLVLQRTPPVTGTPVYMVGSPSGLSLKHSGNGTVLNEVMPAPQNPQPVTL